MKFIDNGIWFSLEDLNAEKLRFIDFLKSDKCFSMSQQIATGGQIILIQHYINLLQKENENRDH